MENEGSILDKLIQSKQAQDAYLFHPNDIVAHILNNLTYKEREVIKRRFALDGQDKQTLEEIGKLHSITRERIRQIQAAAIKKINEMKSIQADLDRVGSTVKRVLSEYGGIMEETHFLHELLMYTENNPEYRQATIFIVSQLLNDHIEKIKSNEKLLDGWKLKIAQLENAHEIIDVLQEIIMKDKKLMKMEEIIERFKNHNYFETSKEKIQSGVSSALTNGEFNDEKLKKLIYSYLRISSALNNNILDEWGLADWPEVTPKRMSDKVYLVLRKVVKPMHFTEITKTINEEKFDKKIAYPATIHNELILDDRFVLVGRGIYALKEWGYKEGTVSEVITDVLKEAGHPIGKDQIVEAVLKRRMVKTSTIYLALTNKSLFKRVDELYTLA